MPFTPYKIQPSEQAAPSRKSTPVKTKRQGIFSRLAKDVKSSFTSRQAKQQDTLQRVVDKKQNAPSALAEVVGESVGTLSDVIGAGAMAAGRGIYRTSAAARSLVEPGNASDVMDQDAADAKALGEAVMASNIGKAGVKAFQQGADVWNKFKKEHPSTAGYVSALVNTADFASNFIGAKAGEVALKEGVRVGAEIGEQSLKTGARALEKVGESELVKSGTEAVTQGLETKTRLLSRVATNKAAKKATREAVASLPDTARNAVNNGVDINDARLLIAETAPEERAIQKKMLEAAKSGADDPADIAGNALRSNLKSVEELAEQKGGELGNLASEITADKVKGVRDNVIQSLRKVPGLEEVTISPNGKLNFSDTRLTTSLTSADRDLIQAAVDGISGKGGKSLHKLRQELFEALKSAKKSQKGYVDTSDKAIEAVRKGISDALDAAHPGYQKLNKEYARIAQPLEELRGVFKGLQGASEDILDAQGGLLMRRLTSNAQSGLKLRKLLKDIDAILKEYGAHSGVDLSRLQEFSDALHNYYDLAKHNSLAGQVREGVNASDIPVSTAGIANKALGKVVDVVGQYTSVTPEVKRKALEDLIQSLE